MNAGEEDHRGRMPFSSYQMKGAYHQQDVLVMLTLVTRLILCLSGFSPGKLLPLDPFQPTFMV